MLYLAARATMLAMTIVALVAVLRTSPFTAPLTERGLDETRLALERAMARTVTADWVIPRMEAALAADDLPRAEMLAALAADHAIPLPPDQTAALTALRAQKAEWLDRAMACGRCALDLAACESVEQLALCGISFEMTPAGDINALRRAGLAALTGAEVDGVEVGLALVGLGATALALPSLGTTGPVKAGATAVRMARKLGTLTPGFSRVMADVADLPVRWSRLPAYLAGNAPLDEVTDGARVARLGAIAGDVGRIYRNTSAADTVLLLRHVDSAEDAARLARLSDAAGPATPRMMEVLGKSRAFRAMLRLSDAAAGALALIWALAVQLGTMLAGWLGGAVLRALRPRAVAKTPPLRHHPPA